jgi:hypothetical protein
MINWNNFKFIIKRNTIDKIYVDGFYMDIKKLQATPIWDRYHNFIYWLDNYYNDVLEVTNKKIIDYALYEEIRNYINDNRVNKYKINLEVL